MMRNYIGIWVIILAGLFPGCRYSATGNFPQISVIPQVVELKRQHGNFVFDEHTVCYVESDEQKEIAHYLGSLFTVSGGFTPEIKKDKPSGKSVVFITDKSLSAEAYELDISSQKIIMKSSGKEGFFYAVQTIRQLLPPAIDRKKREIGVKWEVPALYIKDFPRFAYRGLMLDVSRFFIPKENVLELLDCMAILKINKLHFHLADDNGWRLEIKKYPLLTKVGAWRVYRESDFPQRKNASEGESATVGGYYTQEDIKEIVTYAAERQIEVIPEIEMPAHTNAALAAYPDLACPVVKEKINVLPGIGGDASKIVYCAGNEKVFAFLQDIIDEVAALFPSHYIHLGGDEASKEYWKKCPLCKARMQKLGITKAEDLQGYFMARVSDYVHAKGKEVMGWDELTNSKIPEGAVIFGWRQLGEAGYKAGKQGHKFVMTPARKLYFIRYQGPQWFEPRTYFGNNTLKDVYTYEPAGPGCAPDVVANLLGVQGSLWTEFVNTADDVEYLLFPRLIALSEIAWTANGKKDWSNFLSRLDRLLPHFDYMGITYARSMYNIDHSVTPSGNLLKVVLSCIRPDMKICYTIDGTDPKYTSSVYSDTLLLTCNETVKAATFSGKKCMGEILTLNINWNKATAKPIQCAGNPEIYRLVNGVRGSDKHTDFEWCGWSGKGASFIIDLQKSEEIRQINLGAITNYGMGIHLPRTIRFSVSEDDHTFKEIGIIRHTDKEIFKEGIRIEEQIVDNLSVKGRYLKVEFENPGKCPSNHVRPGMDTGVYFDEIQVF